MVVCCDVLWVWGVGRRLSLVVALCLFVCVLFVVGCWLLVWGRSLFVGCCSFLVVVVLVVIRVLLFYSKSLVFGVLCLEFVVGR